MELHNAVKQHGSINAAAKVLGIAPTTFRRKLDIERRESIRSFSLPNPIIYEANSGVKHFILSSAQDKTTVHSDFLNNIEAYAEYLGAEILIGGFTYSKRLFMDNDPRIRSDDVWFAKELDEYIVHDRIELGDNISFCAEMNTLPTASQPLSGLETYTKSKWGIFPHAKIQLRSIATMKNDPAKQVMTTGTVTLPNYVRRKSGVKAEFHHQIAAVVVSISDDGSFFCRHIQATDLENGSFYDLDRYVSNGEVTEGHRPEAMIHGDIHIEKIDPAVAWSTWGYNSEKDTWSYKPDSLTNLLNPKVRVFHDLMDFSARNHHNINDHHYRLRQFYQGEESVKDNLETVIKFLKGISNKDILDVIVQSNHDDALYRWVRESSPKFDPVNYEFWLECELHCVRAIKNNEDPNLFKYVLMNSGVDAFKFVDEDSCYKIFDIEIGIHGHHGANGGKGSPSVFSKIGTKSITAHSHSPSITDGHMCVGTNSRLDMGYNKGLSSWAHTNAIIYPNGQRALLTMCKEKWFV